MRALRGPTPFGLVAGGLLFGLLALAPLASRAAEAEEADPLTVEDVVRAHAGGAGADALVELIETAATTELDLSPEMLGELRRVGLAAEVIEALRRRAAAGSLPTSNGRCLGRAPVRVVLGAGRDSDRRRVIQIYDEIPPEIVAAWRLGRSDGRRFGDVAMFLACRTPDHVPHAWIDASPMRDARPDLARHGMLAFAPGAAWDRASFLRAFGFRPVIAIDPEGGAAVAAQTRGATERLGILGYRIPEAFEVALAPGTHDLSVGLALQVGASYRPWSVSSLDGVVVPPEGLTLEVKVSAGRDPALERLRVAFDAPEACTIGGERHLPRARRENPEVPGCGR